MNISQSTIDDIKKLSAEDLTTIGALNRVGDKANEYICPFCNNGGNGNRDATGIKPLETNTHRLEMPTVQREIRQHRK